jgi:hypothetical protein
VAYGDVSCSLIFSEIFFNGEKLHDMRSTFLSRPTNHD